MKKVHVLFFGLFLLCQLNVVDAQEFTEYTLRTKLDEISGKSPNFNNTVQLNVSGLALSELVSTIALENDLNISIDPSFNQPVTYNFFNAQVKDILVFVYLNFEVEYKFIGTILSIQKRTLKKEEKPVIPEKAINVKYNPSNEFLSVDLKDDSLVKVVRELTKLSNRNIVLSPEIKGKVISAYFLNRPFDQVLEMVALANGLETKKDEKETYYLFNTLQPEKGNAASNSFVKSTEKSVFNGVKIEKNKNGTINILASEAEFSEVIQAASKELNAPYFFHSRPEGKLNFEIKNTTFSELLDLIFTNTKYSFLEDSRVYLIGENKSEGIRVTELIRMENRTIENVKAAIPKDLTSELEILEFEELNGLVTSGSKRKVDALRAFLQLIDVVVPMVQMDVMIIISDKSHSLNSGIKAGLKDKPTDFSGDVFPQVDVNMGSSIINSILDGITGFGVVNLGNVTENFYLSLQLSEANGFIEVESTPKITTLSGHMASVSIGQTTYYQETQVNVSTTAVNQGVLQSKIWKSIDANLTVKIKPFVSADDNVTLSITVNNDDFEARTDLTAPPNTTKQTFESVVRVRNGEVILLGGLEKKQDNNTGNGVPFLSRIPFIRWFFSSRAKTNKKYKMHVILKPTITY